MVFKDGENSTLIEADVNIAIHFELESDKYYKNTSRARSQNCPDSSFAGLQQQY